MNNTTSDNTQEQPSLADNIKKILSDFNTKLIFILVSLFILCYAFIMGVIDKYIANGILSGFNDNIAERILFIFVVILLIYHTVIDIRNNKKVSNSRFEWACTVLLFWAYYRFFSKEWIYLKFWNFNNLLYIDIVPIYSLLIIIKKSLSIIRNILSIIKKLLCKKNDANIQGFLVDLPIKEEKSDSLGRDNIAKELAVKIKNTPIEKDSFSIGIESPWGDGKTSFLNLLCKHFEDKDTIIIKFNPWNYEKERNLVDAFFLELREKLKIYDSSLSTNLTEYARILSDSNHDIIKFGAKFIECFSSQSIEAKRKVINSAIKRIGKLILVIIDDLDRLDKDEIISVLKLIRNTANFPNMVFVSAYDKEYLIETLKDDVCNSNKYLEKIFQYQFKLPEFDKSKLREILLKEGEMFIDDSDKEEFQSVISNDFLRLSKLDLILNNIDNIRDVFRFLNSLKFVYQRLQGEILIRDLMMIELLRMKYNDVYELLSKEHTKYLTNNGGSLMLWNDTIEKSRVSLFEYKDILKETENKYKKDSDDFKRIESLLDSMFNKHNVSRVPKAIDNPFYIDRYFYYSLLDTDIPEDEFRSVMKGSFDTIKQNIDEWVDNGKSTFLTIHLQNIKIKSSEEYKKVIKCFFYLGSKIKSFSLDNDFIENLINTSPLEKNQNKEFIYGVFFENGVSKFVVIYIQNLLNNIYLKTNHIFSSEEYLEISAKMFKMVCKDGEHIGNILQLLLYTHYKGIIKNDDKNDFISVETHNEEADNIFFKYFKSNYSKFLPFIISYEYKNNFLINSYVLRIWKSKDDFISFINELFESNKEDKQLEEFVEFMNKYFAQESLAPIPFDFKYIKLDS